MDELDADTGRFWSQRGDLDDVVCAAFREIEDSEVFEKYGRINITARTPKAYLRLWSMALFVIMRVRFGGGKGRDCPLWYRAWKQANCPERYQEWKDVSHLNVSATWLEDGIVVER